MQALVRSMRWVLRGNAIERAAGSKAPEDRRKRQATNDPHHRSNALFPPKTFIGASTPARKHGKKCLL